MKVVTIQARATGADVECYQELLRGEWSRQTLDDVLSLLHKLVATDLKPIGHPWQRVLTLETARKAPKDFDEELLGRLRDLSQVFREPALPRMPEQFTATRPSRLAAQAEQAWAYLLLQGMADVQGATGLFADAQSLLYLCCAHLLLPPLERLAEERACLLCAMYVHTLLVWRTQPAHMLHLQQALMGQVGAAERQLNLLDMAFLLTPPDDHAYLTRATAYWAALMELGRHHEAWAFLLTLTRHAPDAYQEEIRGMLEETPVVGENGSR